MPTIDRHRLLVLVLEKVPVKHIARRLGVSRQAVYDALARENLPTPAETRRIEQGVARHVPVTRDAMLDYLRLKTAALGRVPGVADFDGREPPGYSLHNYKRRFGRLGDALRAAGLRPRGRGEPIK